MKKIVFIVCFFVLSMTAFAQNTYYWFGGAGNWSEVSHWSLTSGNSGGALAPQVPTANDNVIFDDNSGFGTTTYSRLVTFNQVGYSKDFSVLTSSTGNAPRFLGVYDLHIYGSFLLSANTEWLKNVGVYFRSTGTASITTNGVNTNASNSNWVISSGTYQLAQNWNTGSVTVSQGSTFTTNNYTLNAFNFIHNGHLNLGSSNINCGGTWTSSGTGATVDAGTSNITVASGTHNSSSRTGFVSVAGLTWYNVNLTNTQTASLDAGCTFNDVVFAQRGTHLIKGNNTFKSLTLAAGGTFEFYGDNTQTILGTFTANTPDCTGLMDIQRYSSGVATLKMPAGSVTNIANARITNMIGSGGTFNVTGVDNGGNTGFSFTSPQPKTIYWVGGADGNWNNQANWSQSSGGVGGYCIPTQFDDVIFDANSNASVPVSIPANTQVYCHNITVTGWKDGNLVLTGGTAAKLNIYGANTWKNGMTYSVPSTAYQSKDAGELLTFDGVEQRSVTYFSGTGGWVFQDDFNTGTGTNRVIYHLWLESGILNTNSKSVYLDGAFNSAESSINANNPRSLILGSSELNVRLWLTRSYGGSTTNYSLNAGTSHIKVRGEVNRTGFDPLNGQTFNNVTMLSENDILRGGNLTFNEVNALGNLSFVAGNKTYQKLLLAGGKAYSFEFTQVINKELVVASQPCGLATQLINTGNNGRFSMPSAAVDVIANNVYIQNLAASGGNSFTANGVDLGGNTGWAFTKVSAKTLYWIGGSGQWNDPAHWTTNANGTPSGAGCIPNAYDDVVFNQYSGPGTAPITVTVANSPAYFKNMNWTAGSPVGATIMTNQHIYSYGSMDMGQKMVWTHAGTVSLSLYFRSPDIGQKITFNGSSSRISFDFDGAGAYQFQDDVKLVSNFAGSGYYNGTLFYRNGSLDFNGKKAEVGSFINFEAPTRNLNIAGSQITVELDLSFSGTSGTLTAGGSMISVGRNFSSGTGFQWNDVILRNNEPGNFSGGGSAYNKVNIKKSTTISGNNTFKTLQIDQSQLIITLTTGSTQSVEDMLYLSGTPCQQNTITSTAPAYIKVLNGNLTFDYVIVRNMNASGSPLVFERNSTNQGGNSNITFVQSTTTGLVGLGPDWLCHEFSPADASTYTLNAGGFFGGPTTTYSWTKVGDPAHTGVLGTGSTLDIAALGFGTYRVAVNYGGGVVCAQSDEITVFRRIEMPVAGATQSVCKDAAATVARLTATGSDLKWYSVATGGTPLAASTALVDGSTYYVTQTISGCESNRVAVLLKLISCSVISNPALRSRVSR